MMLSLIIMLMTELKRLISEKADIEVQKPDNEAQKPDIQTKLLNVESSINSKTKEHIVRLYSEFGIDRIFGRTEIERFT